MIDQAAGEHGRQDIRNKFMEFKENLRKRWLACWYESRILDMYHALKMPLESMLQLAML